MRKQTLALAGLVVASVTGVFVVHRLDADQEYRRVLAAGEQALDAGHPNMAVDAFTHALTLRPASMVAYYRRGEAFARAGQDERAIRDLQQARRLTPEAPEPLEALGRLADERGNPAEAATWYAQATDRLRAADARLLYTLALARYKSGSPGAALDPLRRALLRNPSMSEAHHLLGLVLRDTRKLDEAIVALEQAVRLTPTLLSAREELADLYRENGHVGNELLQLRTLATLDPDIDRHVAVAMSSLRAGRPADAAAAIAQAEAIDPNDSRVALALGRLHLDDAEHTGNRAAVSRALAALERALGGTARRSEGLALYGRAVYLSGDAAGAERLLTDAIRTSPVDHEAFAYLADAAERARHPAVARDALLKLDALQGDTVSSRVRLARARRIGELSLSAGDARMSVGYLAAAVKGGVTDADTYALLARALWQTNDRDGARDALDRALALDATNPNLRRLARTMK